MIGDIFIEEYLSERIYLKTKTGRFYTKKIRGVNSLEIIRDRIKCKSIIGKSLLIVPLSGEKYKLLEITKVLWKGYTVKTDSGGQKDYDTYSDCIFAVIDDQDINRTIELIRGFGLDDACMLSRQIRGLNEDVVKIHTTIRAKRQELEKAKNKIYTGLGIKIV